MSAVVKRSVSIRGHRTSFSLEQEFFDELAKIAAARDVPLARLVGEIDEARPRTTNLSSALRLYVLEAVRNGG
ncbi:ribbon-helix-helix domain-containing protein [Mesorhizobium microcysteis]|uniref:Ribbon-helix-helix domain-containing protein n=1 Tax=Neoaquamicrobium microcysteis TaxID=2682781 RepID=A0A5D4GWL1_9HYPH|nr:ribbon-helix-helix domain-containing protein [Mesorhizobium microcysteis]TYR32402.1 ribbon-helix-helix domain-containing protein [Mesorhizobium microcysteis]